MVLDSSGTVRGEGTMADFCASAVRTMTLRSGMCFLQARLPLCKFTIRPLGARKGGGSATNCEPYPRRSNRRWSMRRARWGSF